MKDSTETSIARFIVLLFIATPLVSYCTMATWNDVLVPLAGFKVVGFWESVRIATALGLATSLFNRDT